MSQIFSSERLIFRSWTDEDIEPMSQINADEDVMRFFPRTYSTPETAGFLQRSNTDIQKNGYSYFAVEHKESSQLIGFIGISDLNYEAPFTPCIEIGWRISKNMWNQGYATEGAIACLKYAFDVLGMDRIIAVCPEINLPSERIMQKIGMIKRGTFIHPNLAGEQNLRQCVYYEMTNEKDNLKMV